MKPAKVICAWCKTELGETQNPEGLPSHGICKPCLEKLMGTIRANPVKGK